MTDKRRYGVIEVRRLDAETYWLEIAGQMWSEVEWSRTRQRWCIQDAAGRCLTHVEHIVGQDRDVQTAIRLAKRMIVDGRMPSPEDAIASLKAGQRVVVDEPRGELLPVARGAKPVTDHSKRVRAEVAQLRKLCQRGRRRVLVT